MDFPMFSHVYKPRRGLKRGEESKVGHHFSNYYPFITLLPCCARVLLSRERLAVERA